jgi:small redox-active disulfide protein 2
VKEIKVLGHGCANCNRLEANAREALARTGLEARITHVTDDAGIMAYGVLSTPGLVIDGQVASYGRVPSTDEITRWLVG